MGLTFEKTFLIRMLMVLLTCACQVMSRTLHQSSIAEIHEQWMVLNGRTYKDEAEKQMRLNIFKENLEYIEKANKEGNRTYKLGTNKFSDLTNEEFRASYTGYKMPSQRQSQLSTTSFRYENVMDVPTRMDWRERGAVTGVKMQGHCGSCWSFSAVGAVEGIIQITTGKLIPLSEQQLVDCSNGYQGCGGGWMDNAFKYIIENRGIASETDYPYQGIQGPCRAKEVSMPAAQISKYEDVPPNDEQALLKAVTMQPVSVCIEGSGLDFQQYQTGVFNGPCGTQCSHAVTLIGYGTTEDGVKYWLIKNSWSETWGERGYMKVARDVGEANGVCGIAYKSSYPVA